MQPVLIVEGEELKVLNVQYRDNKVSNIVSYEVGEESTNLITYYDNSEKFITEVPGNKKIDFATCLIWKNKNDNEINKIKKRIESYEERMVELSFEHIKCSEPFAEKLSLKNEFVELENKVEALYEALMIIEGDSETDAQ